MWRLTVGHFGSTADHLLPGREQGGECCSTADQSSTDHLFPGREQGGDCGSMAVQSSTVHLLPGREQGGDCGSTADQSLTGAIATSQVNLTGAQVNDAYR